MDATGAVGDVIADDTSNDVLPNPSLESKVLIESEPVLSFVLNSNDVEEFDIPPSLLTLLALLR
jgi:hypothetical protein